MGKQGPEAWNISPSNGLLRDCSPLPDLGASGVLTQISRFVLYNDLRISHLTSELSSILFSA